MNALDEVRIGQKVLACSAQIPSGSVVGVGTVVAVARRSSGGVYWLCVQFLKQRWLRKPVKVNLWLNMDDIFGIAETDEQLKELERLASLQT